MAMSPLDEIQWQPYLQGVARSRRLAGRYVTITPRGDTAISMELSVTVATDAKWMRIDYAPAARMLRLTPIAASAQGSLSMQYPKGKGRQIRIGTRAGYVAWGIIPKVVTRYEADWDKCASILVRLDQPLGGEAPADVPRATSDERRVTKKDPIDPVDPIDGDTAASSVSSASSAALPSFAPDDDRIDLKQVLQLAQCSEPTLYNWMRGRGFPRPVSRTGEKGWWSRQAVAQWLVDRGAGPATRRSSRPMAATKDPKTCQTCGDMRLVGRRMLCRCPSELNPRRNTTVEPADTCDWHRAPGAYVPTRMDEED